MDQILYVICSLGFVTSVYVAIIVHRLRDELITKKQKQADVIKRLATGGKRATK